MKTYCPYPLLCLLLIVTGILSCQQFSQNDWRHTEREEGIYSSFRSGEDLYLYLREGLVLQSAVSNGSNKELDEADRGLDKISVSGDDKARPELRWRDQNILGISYAKGTSVFTEYTLRIKDGAKYLGGGEPGKRSFTFQMEKESLYISRLDHADGAVLVTTLGRKSKEALALSPNSPVRYVYRRTVDIPLIGKVHTADIPATVHQATLADGLGDGYYTMLPKLAKLIDPRKATETTPIPQTVLLRPSRPLTQGATYDIIAIADPQAGLEDGYIGYLKVEEPMAGTLTVEKNDKDAETGETVLRLSFNHAVAEKDVKRIFQSLDVRMDGQTATLSADGGSFSVNHKGKCLTLRFLKPLEANKRHVSSIVRREADDETEWSYITDGVPGFLMAVNTKPDTSANPKHVDFKPLEEGGSELQVDITVPKGTPGLHGFCTPKAEKHHASCTANWPMMSGSGSNVISTRGDGCVRFPITNISRATAQVYRWNAEDAAKMLPLIVASLRDDTAKRELQTHLKLQKMRKSAGAGNCSQISELEDALDTLEEDEEAQMPWRNYVMQRAIPAGKPLDLGIKSRLVDSKTAQGEAVLNLREAMGGQLPPGLYLISIVCYQDKLIGARLPDPGSKSSGTCYTFDYLLEVTDLHPVYKDGRLLVNRLSDGSVPTGVTARPYLQDIRMKKPKFPLLEASPDLVRLKDGQAELKSRQRHALILVQQGEDYRLIKPQRSYYTSESETQESEKDLCRLVCDRPLYRPGDTVHIHGTVRRSGNSDCRLPVQHKGTLHIRKPGGQLMESREVVLDAFGTFSTEFKLPEGEEDVAGDYTCRLALGDEYEVQEQDNDFRITIPCQVFRRDSFQVDVHADIEAVAPEGFTLKVSANDYNGTPLAGGRVELDIDSPVALASEQGGLTAGKEKDGDTHKLTYTTTLDDNGGAELHCMTGDVKEEGKLTISGHVVNDREEYVKVEDQTYYLFPADLTFAYDKKKGRLRLIDCRSGKTLEREQSVQVCLLEKKSKDKRYPGGFVESRDVEEVVVQKAITVPANCSEGVDITALFPGENSYRGTLKYRFRATDGEGRRTERMVSYYDADDDNVQSSYRDGAIVFRADIPASMTAHVFVGARGEMRHGLKKLARGPQEISIPLQAREYGGVEVSLVMPRKDEFGRFSGWETISTTTEVIRPDRVLAIELERPASAAPGQEISLAGIVRTPDGKAAKAEVCLFAVDAGMLSVAPYELPDLTAHFYTGIGRSFQLSCDPDSPLVLTPISLPGVWGSKDTLNPCLGGSGYRGLFPSDWENLIPTTIGKQVHQSAYYLMRSADNGSWLESLLGFQQQQYSAVCEAAPVPVIPCKAGEVDEDELPPYLIGGLNTRGLRTGSSSKMAKRIAPDSAEEEGEEEELPEARLRTDFTPTPVWQARLTTDEEGRFSTKAALPDTLTTYRVFALAFDASGKSFGRAETEFVVNSPVMLSPGTPLFMSVGDVLRLPVTLTNNTDSEGTWTLAMSDCEATQQVTLPAHSTSTFYFDYKAEGEGVHSPVWTARSPLGADAVEGEFPVRFPAPLLKETHHLMLEPGQAPLQTVSLPDKELLESTRATMELKLSTNPLLHFAGSADFLTSYPYACTEQTASMMLPWIFHKRLAPFCADMGEVSAATAEAKVKRAISTLFARQNEDGGLGYWQKCTGEKGLSCPWASAYAGMVLSIAAENGFELPEKEWKALQRYIGSQKYSDACCPLIAYAAARACGKTGRMESILKRALRRELKQHATALEMGVPASFFGNLVDLEFMAALGGSAQERHNAFLLWMKSRGKDYRHRTTWDSAWTLLALAEYLHKEPSTNATATVRLSDGRCVEVTPQRTVIPFRTEDGRKLADIAPCIESVSAPVYVVVDAKAQPDRTDYPGVTEKGLQVTRVYEVKGEDGVWRPASQFRVGDVVRVTLTCAKLADDHEYLVLEDYLPSCMEAINPEVPGQAVGLEPLSWSAGFDHKEYLADRVRGFCTRWAGRDLLNMSYFARVKRAGTSTAPPAAARLMYEPQVYGLSPNTVIRSE